MNLTGIQFAQLDVKVKIEQATSSIHAVTSERLTPTWSEFTRVWAKRMSASDEKFEASQSVALTGNSYMIRHKEGITEMMRVNDGGTYYYIKGIERADRKQYMILRTEKRDNG